MYKNRKILFFCTVTSLFWFSLYAYVPILSPYAESLGASYKLIGLIVGSYGLVQMLLRIPLGILSDSLNKRKLFIIIGIGISLLSSLGLWYSKNASMLLVFRGLSGAAAASWVIFTVLFSSYFDGDEATKAIGIINAFNSLGQMVAMMLSGIVSQSINMRASFILAAAGGLAAFILSFGIEEKKEQQPKKLTAKDYLEVMKDKTLIFVSVLAILAQLTTFSTVYGFTPVAAQKIGATNFELGVLSTLSIIPGIFASALSGTFFTKRYGETKTVFWGFIVSALSCLVIPYTKSVYMLYISQFIGGFGRGVVFPILMGLSIKNVSADRRATAMGFFQAVYGIGMFLGPVIVGALSDAVGLTYGFWVSGLISLLAAVLIFFKPKKAYNSSN